MKTLSDERAFQLLMALAEAGELKLTGHGASAAYAPAVAANRDAEYILTLLNRLTEEAGD